MKCVVPKTTGGGYLFAVTDNKGALFATVYQVFQPFKFSILCWILHSLLPGKKEERTLEEVKCEMSEGQ